MGKMLLFPLKHLNGERMPSQKKDMYVRRLVGMFLAVVGTVGLCAIAVSPWVLLGACAGAALVVGFALVVR